MPQQRDVLEFAEWTVTDTADNAIATATKAAESGKAHYITRVSASFSAAAIQLLQTKFSTTVKENLHVHNQRDVVFDPPLRCPKNTAFSAVLAASGTGGTVGAVNVTGYTVDAD